MTSKTVGAHAVLIALASEAGAPEWTLVLPFGELKARDGRKWTNPPANAASVIAASLAIAGSADMPFDYDHQLDLSAVAGVGGTAIASGWMKQLEARDDGIYARVEWTAPAAAKIDAKEYRYASPVFDHTKDGTVTALRRAALTNRPALDLPALAAEQTDGENMDFSKIAQVLGLGADATEEQILAALAKLTTATAAASELAKVRTGLKLGEDANGDAILTAIAAQAGTAGDADAAVIELQTRLNNVETTLASEQATTKVDAAIKAGKIIPAARTSFIALASENPTRFAEIVGHQPVIIKPGTSTSAADRLAEDGTYTLNDTETALCADMGWDPAAYAAERKKELA